MCSLKTNLYLVATWKAMVSNTRLNDVMQRIWLSDKVLDLDHELWPNEPWKMMVSVMGVKEVMQRIWLSGKVPDLDHELWPNGPWKVMVSITGVKNLTQRIWWSGKSPRFGSQTDPMDHGKPWTVFVAGVNKGFDCPANPQIRIMNWSNGPVTHNLCWECV